MPITGLSGPSTTSEAKYLPESPELTEVGHPYVVFVVREAHLLLSSLILSDAQRLLQAREKIQGYLEPLKMVQLLN